MRTGKNGTAVPTRNATAFFQRSPASLWKNDQASSTGATGAVSKVQPADVPAAIPAAKAKGQALRITPRIVSRNATTEQKVELAYACAMGPNWNTTSLSAMNRAVSRAQGPRQSFTVNRRSTNSAAR